MPEQKGKKKTKRERRRFGSLAQPPADTPLAIASRPEPKGSRNGAKAVKRPRRQLPLWANASIGAAMIVFGIFWAVTSGRNAGLGQQLLLLGAYCAVAAVYLGKALQQYRAKRQS